MKKISVVAMSVAILLLIGSCAQGNVKEATTKPTAPVTKITETPKPTPTVATTTTHSKTCSKFARIMLGEKYCKTVEFVTTVDGHIFAVFNLPADTPIFSPYDGLISVGTVTGAATYDASFDTVKAGNKADCLCVGTNYLTVLYTGVIDGKILSTKKILEERGVGFITRIHKGQVLARTGEMNTTLPPPLDKYNLVMYFPAQVDNIKTKVLFGVVSQSK